MNAEVEQIITQLNAEVCEALERMPSRSDLIAVYLGGSYGRGEGGAHKKADGSYGLYNDTDYFVLIRSRSKAAKARIRSELVQIEKKMSEKYGIDVEFGPPTYIGDLKKLNQTLMWNELHFAFMFVYGKADALESVKWLECQDLSPAEAARLVMNRSVGFLMAAERVESDRFHTLDDRRFIIRNLNKAVLGLCDGCLILEKHYAYTATERRVLSAQYLCEWDAFYQEALNFKFNPYDPSEEDLLTHYKKVSAFFDTASVSFCKHFLNLDSTASIAACLEKIEKNDMFAVHQKLNTRIKNGIKNILRGEILPLKRLFWDPKSKIFIKIFNILLEKSRTRVYINSKMSVFAEMLRLWQRCN